MELKRLMFMEVTEQQNSSFPELIFAGHSAPMSFRPSVATEESALPHGITEVSRKNVAHFDAEVHGTNQDAEVHGTNQDAEVHGTNQDAEVHGTNQ